MHAVRALHRDQGSLTSTGCRWLAVFLEAGVKAAHAVAKVGDYVVDNAGDVRRINQEDITDNKKALGVFEDIYEEWAKVSIDQVFSLKLE